MCSKPEDRKPRDLWETPTIEFLEIGAIEGGTPFSSDENDTDAPLPS